MLKNRIQVMGVINLTPDSFSDAGIYFEKKIDSLLLQLQSLKAQGVKIPDVGAQSTAPTAIPIDGALERRRLGENLLPLLEGKLWPWASLSLDTYRVSTASTIFEKWNIHYPDGDFYFNDVSGILDDELAHFLLSDQVSSRAKNVHYIFTSTFLREREQTSQHLQHTHAKISGAELAFLIRQDWERALLWWKQQGIKARPILDPGFGFSKTREQNLYLLNHSEEWMPQSCEHPVLWGISRKSFLRPPGVALKEYPEILPGIEAVHKNLSEKIFHAYPSHHFVWRLHDPHLLSSMGLTYNES